MEDSLDRPDRDEEISLSLEELPRFPCGPDKRPLVAGGFKAATIDPAQIAAWRALFRDCLWGVPTGAVSDIDVLDIDPEGLRWFEANHHRIPVTRVHRTPRGGLHFFFQHAPGLRCSRGLIAPGVDVRADGGYVIWWPQ
jgi:putative DNA primase/helicase